MGFSLPLRRSKLSVNLKLSLMLSQIAGGMMGSFFLMLFIYDRPFGGKLDGFIPPSETIRTNVRVFNAAHSPFHLSSFDRDSASLSSGTQNPDLYSLCSFSLRCLRRSSWLVGGRPGLLCALIESSSSSPRVIKLYHQRSEVLAT